MGNLLSGSEIAEVGVQIEKNGKDFYNTLVKKSGNKKTKEIFEYLAGEEEKHIAAFRKILNSVQNYEPSESYPGEYFAYMNALAGEHVFTQANKGAEIAEKTKNDKEAINIGIGFEKDSIVFYEGMKKVVPESEQKLIENLIVQERDHLNQLCGLKKNL